CSARNRAPINPLPPIPSRATRPTWGWAAAAEAGEERAEGAADPRTGSEASPSPAVPAPPVSPAWVSEVGSISFPAARPSITTLVVVVGDRARALALADVDGGVGGLREDDDEGLVELHHQIAIDHDGDRLAGLAGCERQG